MGAWDNYRSTIDEWKRANAGWTDEDAIGWGQRYYGWSENGSPSTGGTSTASAAAPYSGLGSPAPDPNRYVDGRTLTPDEMNFWAGAMRDQYGISDFWGTLQSGTPVSGSPQNVWVKVPGGGWASMTQGDYQAYKERQPLEFNVTPAPAYTPPTFTAPTADSIQQDPGYQSRLAEGLAGGNAAAAASGALRSGGQQRALTRFASDLAGRAYEDAWNRAFRGYQQDVANAEQAYQPVYQTWLAQNLANNRALEMNWARPFEQYQFANNDEYRRWAEGLADAYRNRVYSGDNEFRWNRANQDDLRYLTDLQFR